MGLIKEQKSIDLSSKSEPWTDEELADFRNIMQAIKLKNSKYKTRKGNKTIVTSVANKINNYVQ